METATDPIAIAALVAQLEEDRKNYYDAQSKLEKAKFNYSKTQDAFYAAYMALRQKHGGTPGTSWQFMPGLGVYDANVQEAQLVGKLIGSQLGKRP